MTSPAAERQYTTARILAPHGAQMGGPSEAQLAAINARATAPLMAEQVFVFDAVASTDAVDSYFTRVDAATSLVNFVADFKSGRALLDSHDIFRLPIGSTIDAVREPIVDAEGSDGTMQVRVTFWMLRGHVANGEPIDHYIRGIETGQYRRMSSGWGGTRLRWVSEYDGSEMDWEHWPGRKLPNGTREVFRALDANAYETSLVYMNSTPGALVSRLQEMVTARAIPASEVAFLEQAWHVRFDRPAAQQFLGGRTMEWTGQRVIEALHQRVGKTLSQATRAKLSTAQDSMEAAIDAIADLLTSADAEAEEARTMRAQLGEWSLAQVMADAEAGRAYRADLIARARTARVAVQGTAFDADKYAERLARYDLAEIKDEAEDWESRKAQVFQPGRQVPASDPNARAVAGTGEYQVVRR